MTWDSVDRWLHLWPTMFSLDPPMESGRCSWNELRDKTLPTWYSKCSLEIHNLWMTTLNYASRGKGVLLSASFFSSLYILQKSRGQPPQAYSQRHMVQLGFITLKSHLKKSKENWRSSQTLIWLEMPRLSIVHSSTLQGQNVVPRLSMLSSLISSQDTQIWLEGAKLSSFPRSHKALNIVR